MNSLNWSGSTLREALPQLTPGDVLSVLEVVASEHPRTMPAVVGALASSPARSALLELVSLFRVKVPEEIAGAAVSVAQQLDRLERQPHWAEPKEVLGNTAASAIVLDVFARHRAERLRSRRGEIPSPLLLRVQRRLRNAAELERPEPGRRSRKAQVGRFPSRPSSRKAHVRRFRMRSSTRSVDGYENARHSGE